MEKQAYWAGSRFWSRLSLLSLPKENRQLRQDLARLAVLFDGDLVRIKNNLLDNEEENKQAIRDTAKLIRLFNTIFISKLSKLLKEQLLFEQKTKATENESDKSPEVDVVQEPNIESTEEELSKSEYLLKVYNQLILISIIVSHFTHSSFNVPAEKANKIQNMFFTLDKIIRRFYSEYKNRELDKVLDLDLLFTKINELYDNLLSEVLQILPDNLGIDKSSVDNFDQLKSLIKKHNHIDMSFKDIISKEAGNFLTRWIKRNIKALRPDVEWQYKLELEDAIIKARDKLEDFIDTLHDKQSTFYMLKKTFDKLALQIVLVCSKMFTVGKLFRFSNVELNDLKREEKLLYEFVTGESKTKING